MRAGAKCWDSGERRKVDIVEGEERGETGAKVRILMLLNEVCDTV